MHKSSQNQTKLDWNQTKSQLKTKKQNLKKEIHKMLKFWGWYRQNIDLVVRHDYLSYKALNHDALVHLQ